MFTPAATTRCTSSYHILLQRPTLETLNKQMLSVCERTSCLRSAAGHSSESNDPAPPGPRPSRTTPLQGHAHPRPHPRASTLQDPPQASAPVEMIALNLLYSEDDEYMDEG